MSKSETMTVVLRQQQTLIDECPRCDICGKLRFIVSIDHITANHKSIASSSIYELCKGPDSCEIHCTCHLEIPRDFGITHILHIL